MPDMWVSIANPAAAELACRQVFGENMVLGPVRLAPPVLLRIKESWPGRTDEAQTFSLELPWDFDISRSLGKGERKSVVLVLNLVDVLCGGKKIGTALRTNALGFNAISTYEESWASYHRKIRQAH